MIMPTLRLVHEDLIRSVLDGLCLAIEMETAELIGFDAWMRRRTERAHAEFMARTSIMLEVDRRKVLTDLLYKHVVRPLVLRVAEAVRTA